MVLLSTASRGGNLPVKSDPGFSSFNEPLSSYSIMLFVVSDILVCRFWYSSEFEQGFEIIDVLLRDSNSEWLDGEGRLVR
jgi:hypothetical protein